MKYLLLVWLTVSSPKVLANQASTAKQRIYEIAVANIERTDNFLEVRKQLQIEIDKLLTHSVDQRGSLEDKTGVWRQLWTDDSDDLRANNRLQKVNRRRTYQVVYEDGYFYNLTEINTVFGKFSGFLRGVYEISGPSLKLKFTKLRLKWGGLGPEAELIDLTAALEAGKLNTFRFPFGSDEQPNGPVGATGQIRTVYVDEDLRIDIGSNDLDGVEDLFILTRL